MATIKRYLFDPSLTGTTKITALLENDRPIVRLAETWFHPQGGGQKADRGYINDIPVLHVAHANDEIDHVVASTEGLAIGVTVRVVVDADWRQLNSAYHTVGHLIAHLGEALYPSMKAISGHHWPGEARVEFTGELPAPEEIKGRLQEALKEAIASDLAVQAGGDPLTERAVAIDEFPPMPCGGTHIAHLGLAPDATITQVRSKKGRLRISYAL